MVYTGRGIKMFIFQIDVNSNSKLLEILGRWARK